MADRSNVSADLVWEIVRQFQTASLAHYILTSVFYSGNNNAFLVKRNSGGGVRFSRDPLNPVNKHSRKVSTQFPVFEGIRANLLPVCRLRQ